MTKWEHKILRLWDNVSSQEIRNEALLDNLGKKGWELVSVDNGIAYFKRLIEEEIPVYKDGIKLEKYSLKESN